MEEAEPVIAENAHHLECDGLSSFMLFGPCVTPDMKHLKTVQLQTVSELTRLVSTYPTRNDIVEIGGKESANSRLAVRRTQPNGAVTDITVAVDLTKPDTRQQIRSFAEQHQS